MIIYDKAQWHIDAGENANSVVDRFKVIFEFLVYEDLLTTDGIEVFEMGIDSSISLNENLVNDEGNRFLEQYYDEIISLDLNKIKQEIKNFFSEFRAI